MKSFKEFIITEKVLGADVLSWLSKKVFTKDYTDALKSLKDLMDRKAKEAKETKAGMKHGAEYYAMQVARSYANVNDRVLLDLYKTVNESEAPTNTTVAVAAPDSPFKKTKVAGNDCIEVDSDTYEKCKFGKKHYGRWENHVQDEQLRSFIKSNYSKSKSLMISNKDTGAHVYFKRSE